MSTENLYAPKKVAEKKVVKFKKKTILYFGSVLLLRDVWLFCQHIFGRKVYEY